MSGCSFDFNKYQALKKKFNLDNSADRLAIDYFIGIDFDLLEQKILESKTCLMQKNSSAYIIKNYVRIINDEMKDFPKKRKKKTFENERNYSDIDFNSIDDFIDGVDL